MNRNHLNLYLDLNVELVRQIVRLHSLLEHAEINTRDWERVFHVTQTVTALAEAIHFIVSNE